MRARRPPRRAAAGTVRTGNLSVLHHDPVIIYAPDWEPRRPDSPLWEILAALAPRTVHLVLGVSWHVREGRATPPWDALAAIGDRWAHVAVTASAATREQAELLRSHAVPAVHCAPSALLREELFAPLPDHRPRYDAIYDAVMSDYKRHPLAGSVGSLALVCARYPNTSPPSLVYQARSLFALRRAHWLNTPYWWWRHPRGVTVTRRLTAPEVNRACNDARVGLCLSAEEGAMFASLQYLLAGLPVVTTDNRGGRDEFFAPAFVRWVDDDPRAVADAVAELAALELDPWSIRAAAIERMRAHRARLHEWILRTIATAGGEPGRWAGPWPADLPHKLREPKASAAEILAAISRADRGAPG